MGKKIFNFSGLRTNINDLIVAEGSLAQANNVEVDERNQLSLRRGYNLYGSPFPSSTSVFVSNVSSFFYNGRLYVTYFDAANNFQIWYDSDGSGTFTGQAIALPSQPDIFQQFQSLGSVFFNTTRGIYCVDALGATATLAGAPRGLGGAASLTGITGFFTPQTQVAYRVTISRTDANSVFIEGAPSQRIEIANASNYYRNVTLRILIPPNTVAGNVMRVYRSGFSASATRLATDDLYIVYEYVLAAGDITAGVVTLTDTVLDEVKGAALHTNRNEDGATKENSRPPLAKRIALYKDMALWGNTKQPHNLNLKLLNVQSSGSSGLQTGDTVTVRSTVLTGVTKETLTDGSFASGAAWTAAGQISYDSVNDVMSIVCSNATPSGTLTQANASLALTPTNSKRYSFRYTVRGDVSGAPTQPDTYLVLSTPLSNESIYLNLAIGTHEIEFISGASASTADFVLTLSGSTADNINLQLDNVSLLLVQNANNEFTVFTNGTIGENIGRTARSLIECVNVSTTPDLANVYAYYVSGYNDFPGAMYFEMDNFTDTITFISSSARAGASFSPNITASTASTAEVKTNRLYVSKNGEVHATPRLNYDDIGSSSASIDMIAVTRDNFYVFKSDGAAYVGNGTSFDNLNIRKIDSVTRVRLPAVGKNFANDFYMFTNFGFQKISDAGIDRVSVAVNDLFNGLFTSDSGGAGAYANESEKKYFAIMSTTAGAALNDPFVYSSETGEWTRQVTGDVDNAYLTGSMNPTDEKMYQVILPNPTADFEVWKQRKNFTNNDFRDREISVTVTTGGITTGVMSLSYLPLQIPPNCFIRVGSVTKRLYSVSQITGAMIMEDDGQTLPTGAGTVITPIEFEIETQPIHFGEPDRLKVFQEIIFNFGNLPIGGKITFGVMTESKPRTTWTVIIAGNEVRTWLPDEYMCAKWIKIYVKISEIDHEIILKGMEVNAQVLNTQTLAED